MADNPLLRPCPACGAAPRQRCTSPSRRPGGRRDLDHHFHDARTATGRQPAPAREANRSETP
ncbi:zinc finger domain-containing protein [Amycolatopsis taiwanensis]|uniref:zinc finger domain-containing protein n=1 Tax=Amycolatopsis taiwanensis TaxID=342230 RepID=UPI003CCC3493